MDKPCLNFLINLVFLFSLLEDGVIDGFLDGEGLKVFFGVAKDIVDEVVEAVTSDV